MQLLETRSESIPKGYSEARPEIYDPLTRPRHDRPANHKRRLE